MKRSTGITAALVALAVLTTNCGDAGVNSGGESKYLNMFLDVFSKNPGGNNDTAGTPNANATYTLTVNVSPAEGTVSRTPNADSYKAGTAVTVTVAPKAGYEFLGWSGALNSSDAQVTITMNSDKTLTASFQREGSDLPTYDLYFNANGATGSAPLPVRTVSGNSITLPGQVSMEKPGYSLAGWTEDKSGEGTRYEPNTSYTVTRNNVTLYAKWVPIYKITFNANGAASGSAPAAVSADSGAAIKLPDQGNMVRGGYNFGGWSTKSSGSGDDYGAGASYTVTGNVTLYARWNDIVIPEYGVAYNGNGNTSGSTDNSTVMYKQGSVITLRSKGDLAKDGYTFGGWCTNQSGAGTVYPEGSSYTVTGGVTFYAKWVALQMYIVTFNGNGNTSGSPPTKVETYSGGRITLPGQGSMERSGYSFEGWNTSVSGAGTDYAAGSSYTVNGNVTLYAKWTTAAMVTFNGNGNTSGSPPASEEAYLGSRITLPGQGNMEKSGYSFGGWNTNASGTGTNYNAGSYYTVNGNITLYAKWTVTAIYTVTFNGNNNTGGTEPYQMRQESGKTITLPDPGMEKSGYIFGGWNTNDKGTGTNYAANSSYTVTGNVILYANWIAITYYTVTFNGNNNTNGTIPSKMSQESGKTITLPGPGNMEKNGYNFGGWNTNSLGTGTNYVAYSSYTVTGNVTLYAKWNAIVTYTVTFNGNGNTSGTAPSPMSQESGYSITLPGQGSMERSGYSFDGWNTNAGGTGTNYSSNSYYTVSGNVTLYAKWTAVTYTLTTNANPSGGGTVSRSPNQNSYTSGTSVTVTATAASGYTFTGWSGSASGATNPLTITMDGNKELTANFQQNIVYESVVIGGKRWMKKNLNIATANSWCYGNDPANCDKYGRLYTWDAARTACPSGWHLPSNQEWDNLVTAAGGSSVAGSKLKSVTGWEWSGIVNTDEFGFSALPGGYRYSDGGFDYAGDNGYWWTATEDVSDYAYYRLMNYSSDNVFESSTYESYGLSVRCVQD